MTATSELKGFASTRNSIKKKVVHSISTGEPKDAVPSKKRRSSSPPEDLQTLPIVAEATAVATGKSQKVDVELMGGHVAKREICTCPRLHGTEVGCVNRTWALWINLGCGVCPAVAEFESDIRTLPGMSVRL